MRPVCFGAAVVGCNTRRLEEAQTPKQMESGAQEAVLALVSRSVTSECKIASVQADPCWVFARTSDGALENLESLYALA